MAITPHRPISTLCLNPALDVTYHVNRLIPDEKSRADSARYDPGGNGINIGRALTRLDIESHTICVIAGAVGQIFRTLLYEQLPHVVYEEVSGETRINTTIIETGSHNQFQITSSGTDIPERDIKRIADDFIEVTGDGYGIITGSCQPNVSLSLYAELVERINRQGGRAVVDVHGEMLKRAIAAKPFMIKPNKYELEMMLDESLPSPEAVAQSARRIQQGGVDYVCVSLSHEGALLVTPENSYFAKALDVTVNTTVGAGDSMVAGLVAGFSLHDTPEKILTLGLACGAGTVMHPGTELFDGSDIDCLSKQVVITKLDI